MPNINPWFFAQGIILSLISIGFFLNAVANAAIGDPAWRNVTRLIGGLSLAWILDAVSISSFFGMLALRGEFARALLMVILFVLPTVFFITCQMAFYGHLSRED